MPDKLVHSPSDSVPGLPKMILLRTGSGTVTGTAVVTHIIDRGLRTHSDDGRWVAGSSRRRIALGIDGGLFETRSGSGYWRPVLNHHIDGVRAVFDRLEVR